MNKNLPKVNILKPNLIKITTFSIALMLLVTAVFVFISLNSKSAVEAQSTSSITGYAWSDTVGWLSFNGSGYGLSVNSSGVISGYAWSDNIGWVSANSSDLSGCPSSPCTATIDSGGNFDGWLRAIEGGAAQSGGWDGFISLSGSGYGPARQSGGNITGYAWGSDVVGWLNFAYATTDYLAEPTADLKVRIIGSEDWEDSLTIQPTDEIELAWNQSSTQNTTSCEVVPPTYNFSTGSAVSGIDSDVEEPIGNSSNSYRIICYGDGSSQKIDTATVTTVGGVGARFCSDIKTLVARDSNVSLCWELGTNDPSMCSIRAGDTLVVLSPLPSASGSVAHRMIGEVEFTLDCTGGDSDTLNVKVLPDLQET